MRRAINSLPEVYWKDCETFRKVVDLNAAEQETNRMSTQGTSDDTSDDQGLLPSNQLYEALEITNKLRLGLGS